jgi:hypothetical protein
MVKSIPLCMLKIGLDKQRVWPHFLQRGFLYDDWNKDTLRVMMPQNQVSRNAISTRVGSLDYITIYSRGLRILCVTISSRSRGRHGMKKRKPVLIIDDSSDSLKAMDLLKEKGIEFVEYDIRKFAESCCGDLPTTKAPSVFAPEGVFKGLSGVEEYITSVLASVAKEAIPRESESAYW